jgi:hypothetical protein
MSELTFQKRKIASKPRDPTYAIYGNIFEQRAYSHKLNKTVLIKRFIVSTEFIQIFYKCKDGEFDQTLFSELTDDEKFLLSKIVIFLQMPENRPFNIAMSKFMKSLFERLRVIEKAVKSGNLSSDLKNEYYGVIDKLISAGALKGHQGTYQKTNMRNTPINT